MSPVLQWLESDGQNLPDSSYVMFSDAFDTGIIGDASQMVKGFLGRCLFFLTNSDFISLWTGFIQKILLFVEYDCEILGMSTVADWPRNKELKLFEEEKYPWSK